MKICPNYGCRSHIRQQVPRHPGESRDPGFRSTDWIPAFAGMTERNGFLQKETLRRFRNHPSSP